MGYLGSEPSSGSWYPHPPKEMLGGRWAWLKEVGLCHACGQSGLSSLLLWFQPGVAVDIWGVNQLTKEGKEKGLFEESGYMAQPHSPSIFKGRAKFQLSLYVGSKLPVHRETDTKKPSQNGLLMDSLISWSLYKSNTLKKYSTHLQWIMAQVLRSLPSIWWTWIEFLGPGFGPAKPSRCGHLGIKLVDRRDLSILSLCFSNTHILKNKKQIALNSPINGDSSNKQIVLTIKDYIYHHI